MRLALLAAAALIAGPGAVLADPLADHCKAVAAKVTDPAGNLTAYADCMSGRDRADEYTVAAPKPPVTYPAPVKLGTAMPADERMPEQVKNTFCATSSDEKARAARGC